MGKFHYFYGHGFNSKPLNYQRVCFLGRCCPPRSCHEELWKSKQKASPPKGCLKPKENRFVNPMKNIDISPINHIYWSYKPKYIMGCKNQLFLTGDSDFATLHRRLVRTNNLGHLGIRCL